MDERRKKARQVVAAWYLGQTSRRYESGNTGVATISTGRGDKGGPSYGAYQLSSREGTLQEYLSQSTFNHHFAGLQPATPAFDARWKELARSDPEFGQEQHVFIGRTHYAEQMRRLERQGITLGERGRAVQDCVWSTSVQFRNLTPRIFAGALTEAYGKGYSLSDLSDREIVEAVQNYKIRHNAELFKTSPQLWNGLIKRAASEKKALVALAEHESVLRAVPPLEALDAKTTSVEHARDPLQADKLGVLDVHSPHRQKATPAGMAQLQSALNRLGYRDAEGRPLEVDGDFGRRTREAVEGFQRANGLEVDGVVGRNTRDALRRMEHPLLTDARHPRHAMFLQVRHALRAQEAQRCIAPGLHTDRLAGAVLAKALDDGLTRVDRVELGATGQWARAVQFGAGGDVPELNRVSGPVSTEQAVRQPLSVASEHVRQAPAPAVHASQDMLPRQPAQPPVAHQHAAPGYPR